MAMIWRAPAMRAPWITEFPTPPHPKTATLEPGATRAVFSAAPTPVVTPQPTKAARSNGMSLSIFTTARSCSSIISANPDKSENCAMPTPSWDSRGAAPLGRRQARLFEQRCGQPRWHSLQEPQKIDVQAMTWSPTSTADTSEPTASTMPAGS